jgi:hypothetical protein
MKTLIVLLAIVSVFALEHQKMDRLGQIGTNLDTIIIKLPGHFDTVDVRKNNPNIIAAIFDKYSQKDYRAPHGFSLDIQRNREFSQVKSYLTDSMQRRILGIGAVSDSLRLTNGAFLKRHEFFVMYYRKGSVDFHRARGEYLSTTR